MNREMLVVIIIDFPNSIYVFNRSIATIRPIEYSLKSNTYAH